MIELKEQSPGIKLRGQSKEYALALQRIQGIAAENITPTLITNIWKGEHDITLGVELPHLSISCLPPSSCNGTVKIHLIRGAKGLKNTVCPKCEKTVMIDQSCLQDELGVTDLGRIPVNDPLKKLLPHSD